jgi:hypothetical protein
MDCYCLRSLDGSSIISDFIKQTRHKNVLGLSTVNINTFESYAFVGSHQTINNAIMFSTPKNPILKHLIETIIKNVKENYISIRLNGSHTSHIQTITGPYFLNQFIQKFINAKNTNKLSYIKLFPHYIFEPAQPFGLCDIRDDTVAIHKFEMSWINEFTKNLYATYFNIKPFLLGIPIIFILLLTKRKLTPNFI